MPINYAAQTEYPFDLDRAHQYIASLAPSLSFLKNYAEFLEQWFQAIQRGNLSGVLRICQSDLSERAQFFQKHITLFDQPVMLHFKANVIQGLAVNHAAPLRLNISSIVETDQIAYTQCQYIDGLENNNAPILLVQFHLGECELLVIDGNHRLSARIYKNLNNIQAYIADPAMALISLPDAFEQSIYLFIHDMWYVQTNKKALAGRVYKSDFLSCFSN